MKLFSIAILVGVLAAAIYWPHQNASFVLDDYYTIVHNPLIKNPVLYPDIFKAHLFDAHQASSYIKFGYYRPVLEFSWILDYRLFGLKAFGYQWVNLLIHALNCLLIYLLTSKLFNSNKLGIKTALLFCVLPTHEWSVRYITSRGDLLSCFFGLLSLLMLWRFFKSQKGIVLVLLFWLLASLSREIGLFYLPFAFLIYYHAEGKIKNINHFAFYWLLIGLFPLVLIWPLIPKLGNILVLHFLYFTLIGACLWIAQGRWGWFLLIFVLMASTSIYQGQFWTSEENLLRHTHQQEIWPNTVAKQQLLMKYDENVLDITSQLNETHEPLLKALWLKRLAEISFNHGNLNQAQDYLLVALQFDPTNPDLLNALAIVHRNKGEDLISLFYLKRSLTMNPDYSETLRSLGIYYYIHRDFPQARFFFKHCLYFNPDDYQAQGLLTIANQRN